METQKRWEIISSQGHTKCIWKGKEWPLFFTWQLVEIFFCIAFQSKMGYKGGMKGFQITLLQLLSSLSTHREAHASLIMTHFLIECVQILVFVSITTIIEWISEAISRYKFAKACGNAIHPSINNLTLRNALENPLESCSFLNYKSA